MEENNMYYIETIRLLKAINNIKNDYNTLRDIYTFVQVYAKKLEID